MKPVEEAAAVYQREPCVRTFREDLEAHLLNGFVMSTERFFYMARPVVKSASPWDIVNPWIVFPEEECDCWHVYLYAGDMSFIFSHAPKAYPWGSFERHNKIRFYPWEAFKDGMARNGIKTK
jgi:hypothetical protein